MASSSGGRSGARLDGETGVIGVVEVGSGCRPIGGGGGGGAGRDGSFHATLAVGGDNAGSSGNGGMRGRGRSTKKKEMRRE
jgi:hypothetical protein